MFMNIYARLCMFIHIYTYLCMKNFLGIDMLKYKFCASKCFFNFCNGIFHRISTLLIVQVI